jgi:hypothetical protein
METIFEYIGYGAAILLYTVYLIGLVHMVLQMLKKKIEDA